METREAHSLKVNEPYRELDDPTAPVYKALRISSDGTGVNVLRDDGKTMWYVDPVFVLPVGGNGYLPASDAEFAGL